MITEDNLKDVLESLGFENKEEIYNKSINKYALTINFKDKTIHYPKEVTIHDKTTSNFSHPENFVVFECVHRLLEKGYKAEHLELEPKWNLGRDKKGGKADILVKDNENNPYLIIECKTTDSKNSEFVKEWTRMQEYGGQLFSYLQQERSVKYLCLYASDFDSNLTYTSYIIQAFDNEEYLNEKKLEKSYAKATNNIELFSVWKESYESHFLKSGIFESNINAYKILETTPTFENLRELKEEGKYHEFAKILRKHNISGKENAFDKLVNIFLCKIYDETFNKDNLKFGYRGVMADTYANMQDRLMWLYKEAMREFLGEKITFVSNDDIEKDFKELKQKTLKEAMKEHIKKLKFYSNNDFAFLEVHNKELFLKNALVLTEIIELFAPFKLTQNSTNQFLGNLFELFLQKGMKQDEGQFFTPIQICEFIMYSLPLDSMLKENSKPLKVIDYACGAGHFLNTYANELKRYFKKQDLKDYYKNIYGIEKEYRLSKVSKVSSAMYGQNEINILYADSLSSFELANIQNLEGEKPKPQIEYHSFDLLIANPPYSVKGFLETLSAESRKTYSLFNNDINIESNSAIECFFVERANQILKDNAKAAIILPSSILNKDSIYKATREILFQNFDFISIVELGNQTFGATGTNTIILFLSKKETTRPQDDKNISRIYSHIKDRLEEENLKDDENFKQNYLSVYCDFRGFDKESYASFLNGNLDSNLLNLDIFKDYYNAFQQTSDYKKLKESKVYKDSKNKDLLENKAFLDYAQRIEKDKLLYFSLSFNQEVLIIKAPSDIKEQKKFLGYEWSNRKGDEGLKELSSPYFSPLFERDNPKNNSKLNTLIYKSFLNTLDSIPQELSSYATKAKLIDMIDFEKVEFNKAIGLNPSNSLFSRHSNLSEESNPFANSKFELVKLENFLLSVSNMANKKISKNNFLENGKYPIISQESDSVINGYTNLENPITDLPLIIFGDHNCHFKYIDFPFFRGADGTQVLKISSEFITKFVYFVLQNIEIYNQHKYERHFKYLKSLKIPLPPLPIQKQIVAECEKVEEQYNTIRMSIEEYQNLIKAILLKTGVINDEDSANTAGGGANNSFSSLESILENLSKLESKLDFNLLLLFQQEQISHSEGSEESHFSKTIQELLQTLPTPPKDGWERVKLKDICNINQETYNPSNDLGEMLYIDIDSVEKGTGKINFNDKIPCKNLPTRARRIARADSVIISTVRPYLKGFAYIKDEIKDSIFSTGFAILNGKENIAKSQFVYYCFMFVDDLMRQIEIKMPKSSYPSINTDDIESFTVPLPPLEIQEKITQSIEAIERQISFIDSKLALLETQKEVILKKYLEKSV